MQGCERRDDARGKRAAGRGSGDTEFSEHDQPIEDECGARHLSGACTQGTSGAGPDATRTVLRELCGGTAGGGYSPFGRRAEEHARGQTGSDWRVGHPPDQGRHIRGKEVIRTCVAERAMRELVVRVGMPLAGIVDRHEDRPGRGTHFHVRELACGPCRRNKRP